MRMRLIIRLRRDDGIAMVTVLMLVMALAAVAVGAIQVAEHSTNVTVIDRERLQTVSSAEAGANAAIREIEVASGPGAVCNGTLRSVSELRDNAGLVGQYQYKISPDSSVPPDPFTCTIDSWGTAPTGGTRARRHLEVQVKLIPRAGFPFTLFAEGATGTIYVKNTGTIDGDIYAEHVDQSKNNVFARDVITTGSLVSRSNGVYAGNIWAAGDVTLESNNTVGGSISAAGTSGAGNVSIGSGSVVNQDVLTKGTITNAGTIKGASSPNNPNVPSPPNLVKPVFDENAITPYTQDSGNVATLDGAMSAARTNLSGKYRYTGTDTITIPNNVTVNGDLTIVSRGSIKLNNSMTIGPNCLPGGSAAPCIVAIIALGQASGYQGSAIDVVQTFTGASGLNILLYTLEGFDAKNGMTFTGSVYADTIDAKNAFVITESDALRTDGPDGFTWDFSSSNAYALVPTLWREVVPGAPS
jgi:cytoskeletal protein CcmA (bactofilin family)